MVKEAKRLESENKSTGSQQQTLFDSPIFAGLKKRSQRDKVIFDFIQLIVDKDAPISCVNDEFYRTLVYRSHGIVNPGRPVCKKTVREIMIELMGLVEDDVKKELVCIVKLL